MLQALLAPVHSEDKRKLLNAIELLGPKVTPELVALETGLPLLTTIRQLNLVAAETNAHLEVDSNGRICYRFAPTFASSYAFDLTKNLLYANGKFAVKLFKIGVRLTVGLAIIVARIAFGILWFLFRISFGVILVGSIFVIIFGLIAVLSNGEGAGDALGGLGDIGGAGADAGSTAGGALLETSGSWAPSIGECFYDLLRCFEIGSYLNLWAPYSSGYYYDDAYRSNNYSRGAAITAASASLTSANKIPGPAAESKERSDFLTDFFSFLFGDGEPNIDLEAKQWQFVGRVIERNNGVVIAEQIAPYMGNSCKNEDWMLPVLVHFNGAPDVTETGNIIYVFPSFVKETFSTKQSQTITNDDASQLQNLYHSHLRRQTVSAIHEKAHLPQYLRERNLVFSLAETHSTYLSTFMVAINLFGSIWFYGASGSMRILSGLHGLAGFMLGFALLASTLPALRAVALPFINARIDRRNELRMKLANAVSKPSSDLKSKLTEAEVACEALASELHSELVYSTENDSLEQEFADLPSGTH